MSNPFVEILQGVSYPTSGEVSYYDNSSVDPRWGGATKSGEKFDENKLTAAVLPEHWQELKGKTVRVTNPDNGKSVEVTVNDTGGFAKYGRVLDLSKAAFKAISDPKKGTGKFKIEIIDKKKEKPQVDKPRSELNLNPFSVTEAQAEEPPIEGNPFKDIVGEAQQIVSQDNPFKGIVEPETAGTNPFSDIIKQPEVDVDKQLVERNINIVSQFTGIPAEVLSPKFYETTGDIKQDAKKLGFAMLIGLNIAYEPIERVLHYPIASLTQKLQAGKPFWKSVWESTASMRKVILDPEERKTFFDVMKTYQQDLNKVYNLPEGYTNPLDKPFEVLGGLALRFAQPDILVGGAKATKYAGKATAEEVMNTLRLGKEATVEQLDRLTNYIREAKDYGTFVKTVRATYPIEEAKSIIRAARQMREIINTTPIGATKTMPGTSIAPEIIPGAPAQVSMPASNATIGEIMKSGVQDVQNIIKEIKAKEVPIPKAAKPQTLLSWVIKNGGFPTKAIQEYLGKDWRKNWPEFRRPGTVRNDAPKKDLTEMYEAMVKEGVITPLSDAEKETYTGGVGQYALDEYKKYYNKSLIDTDDALEIEYQESLARDKARGGINDEDIKADTENIAKEIDNKADDQIEQEHDRTWVDSQKLQELGYTTNQIARASDEALKQIIEQNLGPDDVSILPDGELKIIPRYKIIEDGYGKLSPAKNLDNVMDLPSLKEKLSNLKAAEDNADKLLEIGNYKVYYEGWCNKCYPKDIDESEKIKYSERETPKIVEEKKPEGFDVIDAGYISDKLGNNPYGATYAVYTPKLSTPTEGKVNPFAVEPTMPPGRLQAQVPQTEIPLLTELKHGLSPEVQKVMFDNAQDTSSKLKIKEQAGRVLLPGGGAKDAIQDPKLRAVLYAGRHKLMYLGSGLINWLQGAAKALFEGIRLEYEPTLKDHPQLKDDIRTGPVTFARKGREQAELALGGLIGNLNQHQEDLFWNIVGMQDLIARGGEGLTLPRNLKVANIQAELERTLGATPQETKDAIIKYESLMAEIGKDLINREKLSPEDLKSNYFPHYVLDYLPIWWDETAAFLPRRLRTPYRQYTKQAVGSAKDIAISKEALIWHLSSVFMDNMIDDWAIEQLTKYDKFGLTDEQLASLGPVKPNQVVVIGDKKYRGFQYQPGRQVYPAQITNPSALNKALEEDLSTQDWLASVGPHGGAPVTQGVALGRYYKVYTLPIEIYDRFIKLKQASGVPEFIILANQATNLWKRVTLDFAGIPFQINNFFGDFVNLYRTAPGAAQEIGVALRILKDLRHPDTLSEWQQHVLKTAQDKDVLGAGFVQEYALINAGMSPKGILGRLERLSSLREGVLRIAMLSYQMKRTEVGLPPIGPEFNVQGLDKVSAAAYIARNFTVDYLAIPDWYRHWARGLAAPFITFYHINAKNWLLYTKNAPEGFLLKFLIPILGLWAYNNTGERRQIEERLPAYWRFRPFHIVLKTEDLNGDGNPDRATIWSMQTPVEMAGALIGFDRIMDKVTLIRAKQMTVEEAAKQQLIDCGLGAPRQLHLLLNPLIQYFEGVLSNRDPRTKQEVVPSELERVSEMAKAPYRVRYFIEKMATPFGQYLKDSRGIEPVNILLSGPLDIKRALGFYDVNLNTAEAKIDMDKARLQRGNYDTYMYRIEQAYLEGKDTRDIENEAANNGIVLKQKSIYDRLYSTRVQIDKVKSEMRKTQDLAARRRLEIELDALMKDRVAEYQKTLPKGAR